MHVFKGMKTGLIIIYCQKWWPGKRGMQPMWVLLLLEQHSEEAQLSGTQSLVWEGRQLYHGELCEWLWLTCAVNAAHNASSEAGVQTSVKLQFAEAFVTRGIILVPTSPANPYKLVNASLSGH